MEAEVKTQKSKDRPIFFSTEMVQAILDGRKTVTRRIIKPPFTIHANGYITRPNKWGQFNPYKSPYGKPGDILYVRETWGITKGKYEPIDTISYKSDSWHVDHLQKGAVNDGVTFSEWHDQDLANEVTWKPSIHMPKQYSRIWLRVKDVRVERVQDITTDQIKKEGVQIPVSENGRPLISLTDKFQVATYMGDDISQWTEQDFWKANFAKLWDSINAKRDEGQFAWKENPWVWVVEFEVVSTNGKPEGIQ